MRQEVEQGFVPISGLVPKLGLWQLHSYTSAIPKYRLWVWMTLFVAFSHERIGQSSAVQQIYLSQENRCSNTSSIPHVFLELICFTRRRPRMFGAREVLQHHIARMMVPSHHTRVPQHFHLITLRPPSLLKQANLLWRSVDWAIPVAHLGSLVSFHGLQGRRCTKSERSRRGNAAMMFLGCAPLS